MFQQLGFPELLIILVIVLLIFGVGRVSGIAGEIGRSIREFRKGLSGDDETGEKAPEDNPEKKE